MTESRRQYVSLWQLRLWPRAAESCRSCHGYYGLGTSLSHASHAGTLKQLVCTSYLAGITCSLARVSGGLLDLDTTPKVVSVRAADPDMLAANYEDPKSKVTSDAARQWTFEYHAGFMHNHMSVVGNGLICGQNKTWKTVSEILAGEQGEGLYDSEIPFLLGARDTVVVGKELGKDLNNMLDAVDGHGQSQLKYTAGGYD